MPEKKVIASWIEMGHTYLTDKEPRNGMYEASLLLNRCEVRELAGGRTVLLRTRDAEHLKAESRADLDEKIADFVARDSVRLAAKGLETNNAYTFPVELKNPPQSIVDGTNKIYDQRKTEMFTSLR